MDADAKERIEKLEARIEELEGQQPTGSRRTMLGALAAVGGAGALASPASAAASTSDSDGDVGKPGDRVDAFLDGADANSLDGPVVGGTTVTDLVGPGLELNANTLRLLSTVYDGANLVADVDNSKVTTDDAMVDTLEANSIATELEDGTDKTSSRSLGTTYQNTKSHDIIVVIRSEQHGSGETGKLPSFVSEGSNPIAVSTASNRGIANGDTTYIRVKVAFKVPSGYYYEVSDSLATGVGVSTWYERGVNK